MGAVKKLEDFQADVRRRGWLRSLFGRVILRLQRHAGLNIHWILVRDLVRPPAGPHPLDGINVRVVQAEELRKAAYDPELDIDPEFVRSALARGDMAFGAFDGDRLVCYTWRALAPVPHVDGVWVRFDPPCAYGYKAFTRPSYRGRHILVAVTLYSAGYLLERGRVALVTFTGISNFSSLAAQRAAGSRRIGLAGYVKWFDFFLPFRTPAVKRIGVAFERRR